MMRRWKNCWSGPRRIMAKACKLTPDARASLRAMADGDGRYLLNLAEEAGRPENREAAGFRRR